MEEPNDEMTHNSNDDFEFNGQQENEVDKTAVMNGSGSENHTAPMQQKQSNVINEKVVRSFTIPRTVQNINQDFMMRSVNRPATQDSSKVKNDRDFLESLSVKPEAVTYNLAVHRYFPTHVDGEELPRGKLYDIPLYMYDELKAEIADAWGGGRYRCVVVDEQGRPVPSVSQCVLVDIPTTQHKPKFIKYEKSDSISKVGKSILTANPDSDDLIRLKREDREEKEREQLEYARFERDMRAQKKELAQLRAMKEIAQMRKEMMQPEEVKRETDPQVQILMLKIEDDRRRYEEEKRRQDEDRKRLDDERKEEKRRYEEAMKEERRRHEEAYKEASRQREDDRRRFEEAQAKLFEKIAEKPKDDGIMPILLAMINKDPKVDQTPQLLVEMNKQQTQIMTAAMTPKPTDNSMTEMMLKLALREDPEKSALMKSLLDAAMNKKPNELTPEMLISIMKMGKDEAKEYFQLAQGMSGGVGMNPEVAEDDYDPALGFLGNTAKAIFSSLKALVGMAGQNPMFMELIAKLVGSRNPDDAALANAARMMEQNGMTTQGMIQGPGMTPQLPYQQVNPWQQAPMQAHQNGFTPLPNRQPQAQQQRQVAPVQPTAQQATPSMADRSQQNVPQQQSTQQQQVVAEIEGNASGIPGSDGPAEESPHEMTPQEAALITLRGNVTETVRIMSEEAVSKPNQRSWVEFAHGCWHKEFLARIVMESRDTERWAMIARMCDQSVWKQMIEEITRQAKAGDASEQIMLGTELNKLIDMNVDSTAQIRTGLEAARRTQAQAQTNQPTQHPSIQQVQQAQLQPQVQPIDSSQTTN